MIAVIAYAAGAYLGVAALFWVVLRIVTRGEVGHPFEPWQDVWFALSWGWIVIELVWEKVRHG